MTVIVLHVFSFLVPVIESVSEYKKRKKLNERRLYLWHKRIGNFLFQFYDENLENMTFLCFLYVYYTFLLYDIQMRTFDWYKILCIKVTAQCWNITLSSFSIHTPVAIPKFHSIFLLKYTLMLVITSAWKRIIGTSTLPKFKGKT